MAKTPSERDAIDMLMEDHKRVQRLFKDFDRVERDDAEAVRDLVKTACVELQIHSMLEEELFYPAVRGQVGDDDERNQDLLNEAEVEHESVEEIIAKLQDLEADDPMYYAYFSVLAEYVKHHIKEEEKELFPEVKKMKALDLQQLAGDMRARREELFAEIEEAGESEGENERIPARASLDPLSETEPEEGEDEQEQSDISTRH